MHGDNSGLTIDGEMRSTSNAAARLKSNDASAQAALIARVHSLGAMLRTTPLVRLPHPSLDLHVKLEQCNPFGSLKDRSAYWILRRAVEERLITPESTVVESSSGNFALALAGFCRLLDLRLTAVIDPNVNRLTRTVLENVCSHVQVVTERDDTGGYLKTRLDCVHRWVQQHKASYWPNQYANPWAQQAHYLGTASELCHQLDELDYMFVGVSSGGTIAGVSRRLKERFPRVRVIAVDVEGSVIFGQPPKPRSIPGIGSSIVPNLLQHALIDEVEIVSEQATIRACLELTSRYQIFAGGSTGSAYAAIEQYFRRRAPIGRPRVAFIAADGGAVYADTVYGDAVVDQVRTKELPHEPAL